MSVSCRLNCVANHRFIVLSGLLFVGMALLVIRPATAATPAYSIEITAPQIAENGAVVPVTVNLRGFEQGGVQARRVDIFVCHLGWRPIARFEVQPTIKRLSTRIKMGKTDRLFAMATLSNGERIVAEQQVKVTVGGCGGGGSGESLPYSEDASVPAAGYSHQARTWVRSTLTDNSARLMTADNRHLPLTAMRADVRIVGLRARVLLQMDFYNDSNWQREGNFQLRLPDNASAYYVAFGDVILRNDDQPALLPGATSGFNTSELRLDQNNMTAKLKEGVMVPVKQARQAYNTITRAARDPALVEWQGSGIYSVQVFPLLAYQTHRVVIGYEMDLPQKDQRRHYIFKVPTERVPVDLYVHMDATTRQLLQQITTVPVKSVHGDEHLFHFRPASGESVELNFDGQAGQLLTGEDPATGKYFALSMKSQLPTTLAQPSRTHGIFVLDISARSSYDTGFQQQVALLLQLLAANEDVLKQFAVLTFDVGTHWWQPRFMENNKQVRTELAKQLYELNLAGATDLHRALREVAQPSWFSGTTSNIKWDVFLLTAGKPSWGETRPRALLDALDSNYVASVYAYIPFNNKADVEVLDLLTHAHHGAVFHTGYISSYDKEFRDPVLKAHRMLAWRIVGMEAAGAEEVVPSGNIRYHYLGQQLRFVGRGTPVGPIILVLEADGKQVRHTLELPKLHINSPIVPRMYGETVVSQLEDRAATDEALVMAYASHFRVARKTVSLLMLETAEDYQRFGITKGMDYSPVVRNKMVAAYLATLRVPEEQRFLPGPVPVNQMQELESVGYAVSVCKLPLTAFAKMPLSVLEQRAALVRSPLLLNERDITNSMIRDVAGYGQPRLEQFTKVLKSVTAAADKPASLRLLSSAVNVAYLSDDEILQVGRHVLQLGFANDAYFLLRQQAELKQNKQTITALGEAAFATGQSELATSLSAFEKLVDDTKKVAQGE